MSVRNVPVLRYASWSAFKNQLFLDLCGVEEPQISRFLFRGQRDPSWGLVPSFYRHFGKYNEEGRRIALNALLNRFEQYCQADQTLLPLIESDNRNQRMAFAQHSGLPTDLLDWTESPFIAAFFAAADYLQARQANPEFSIWVIDTFHPIWLAGNPQSKLPPPFTVPGWHNTRLRSQRG